MTDEDPAQQLVRDSRWVWCEGMKDLRGRRLVDLDLHDGSSEPDLADYATAGAIIGLLEATGSVTDIVREGGEWIVAVDLSGHLQGYIAPTLGEAAAWALLAYWDDFDSPSIIA
mgnify:CR=1 FL=1